MDHPTATNAERMSVNTGNIASKSPEPIAKASIMRSKNLSTTPESRSNNPWNRKLSKNTTSFPYKFRSRPEVGERGAAGN